MKKIQGWGTAPFGGAHHQKEKQSMSETILTAENLKFRYDAEQPVYALDGVSAQVKRGEFVAVLGANGCGKSTLAKHFNAILLPETGTVLVEDMDTRSEEHLYDVRQKVGMVFQNPDNQIVATIVEEDVAFAPENLGVPPEEIRTRIDEAMKLAAKIAKGPLNCYSMSKALMNKAHETDFATLLDEETVMQTAARMNENATEGLSAFLEKRKAAFK